MSIGLHENPANPPSMPGAGVRPFIVKNNTTADQLQGVAGIRGFEKTFIFSRPRRPQETPGNAGAGQHQTRLSPRLAAGCYDLRL